MEFTGSASISRERFITVYTRFTILYAVLIAVLWICIGLTVSLLNGTSGYYGAMISLAINMLFTVVHCGTIRTWLVRADSSVLVTYTCCGRWSVVFWHILNVAILLLLSVACIGLSAAGVSHSKNFHDPSKDVNNDANVIMGSVNAMVCTFTFICYCVMFYYAIRLQEEINKTNFKEQSGSNAY